LLELIKEIRQNLYKWIAFMLVFISIYAFYYYLTPVYVYVVSSPYVGPAMIKGFADAYNQHSRSIMPVRVVDFVVEDNEKAMESFMGKLREDMISGRRVVAIVGTDISSETRLLLAELSNKAFNIPVISQSSSSPELQKLYPRFFRLIYNDEIAVSSFAKWYVEKGPSKPVIVLWDKQNATWSKAVASVFSKYAAKKVVDVVKVDIGNPEEVKNIVDTVLKEHHYFPDDVYIFLVDYKLSNIYKVTLALSDRYKNFLMTDSVVKYMYASWLPDDINLYVYYLPVQKPMRFDVDYDYDLSFDTLNVVLNLVGKGFRSSGAVYRALQGVNYLGRSGMVRFVYEDGVYERVFSDIAILKEEGGTWRFITLESTQP